MPAEKKTKSALSGKKDLVNELKRAFAYNLFYQVGKPVERATPNDLYMAVAYTIRDRMQHLFINSAEFLMERKSRVVCYLSAEFLMGPHLENNLINLGLYKETRQALEEVGLDLKEIADQEPEPGLGNGGLGRLAACYLDSLSTLQVPAVGYGIRYEHGMFHQILEDGWQKELGDQWLRLGNPWEIKKPDIRYRVGFGGRTESYVDENGAYRVRWIPARVVSAVAYDTPVPGFKGQQRESLAPLERGSGRELRFRGFQRGRLLRGGRRESPGGKHLQSPLSER